MKFMRILAVASLALFFSAYPAVSDDSLKSGVSGLNVEVVSIEYPKKFGILSGPGIAIEVPGDVEVKKGKVVVIPNPDGTLFAYIQGKVNVRKATSMKTAVVRCEVVNPTSESHSFVVGDISLEFSVDSVKESINAFGAIGTGEHLFVIKDKNIKTVRTMSFEVGAGERQFIQFAFMLPENAENLAAVLGKEGE